MKAVEEYEYDVLNVRLPLLPALLNKHGKGGWRLVETLRQTEHDNLIVILERKSAK